MNGSLVSVAQHPTQIHKAGNSQYSITDVVLVIPKLPTASVKGGTLYPSSHFQKVSAHHGREVPGSRDWVSFTDPGQWSTPTSQTSSWGTSILKHTPLGTFLIQATKVTINPLSESAMCPTLPREEDVVHQDREEFILSLPSCPTKSSSHIKLSCKPWRKTGTVPYKIAVALRVSPASSRRSTPQTVLMGNTFEKAVCQLSIHGE